MDLIIKISIELVILVVAYVAGKFAIPFFKAKINRADVEEVMAWAKILVHTAENIISDKGSVKYDYVAQALAEKMEQLNIKLSEQEIKSIIEDAVFVMKQNIVE